MWHTTFNGSFFFNVLVRKVALIYCLHRLGDALASLSAKKEPVLSGNSRITQILADSLGNAISRLILCLMCFSC